MAFERVMNERGPSVQSYLQTDVKDCRKRDELWACFPTDTPIRIITKGAVIRTTYQLTN